MDLGIQGRVALVAASSQGLGFASAKRLAAEGVRVSICGRRADVVSSAVQRIRQETGTEAYGFTTDLRSPTETSDWLDKSTELLGPADILVANGPGPAPGRFFDKNDRDWADASDAVIVSLARQIRLALPGMMERGWGRIVVINSFTARQPADNLTLSNAVRAGLQGLVKTVALEVAETGVTVNSVLPGPAATERFIQLVEAHAARSDVNDADARPQMAIGSPMRRLADPDEIGATVAFLCSASAAYITGAAIAVDGGAIRAT